MNHLKCVVNNLLWNTRVLISTPGHYILNWQKSASKEAVGNMFHLTNLWKHLQNFVTTTKFTITKAWQKHVEKRYPCIVNGTELFSDILRIKICHVNKTVVANLIISWTFVKKPYCPTQGINLRLLRYKKVKSFKIHKLLNVLRCDY